MRRYYRSCVFGILDKFRHGSKEHLSVCLSVCRSLSLSLSLSLTCSYFVTCVLSHYHSHNLQSIMTVRDDQNKLRCSLLDSVSIAFYMYEYVFVVLATESCLDKKKKKKKKKKKTIELCDNKKLSSYRMQTNMPGQNSADPGQTPHLAGLHYLPLIQHFFFFFFFFLR